MIDSIDKVNEATREELVQFLKEWGFKCGFDGDSLKTLRELVRECLKNKTKKKNYYLTLSNKLNFFVRPLWKPMHLLKPFRNSPKMNLSNTAKIYENTFSLPSSVFLLKNKRK